MKKRYPRKSETVYIEAVDRDVTLFEVTLGYLSDIDNGSIEDSAFSAVFHMSDMTHEDMKLLSESTLLDLYRIIFVMTYGEEALNAVHEVQENQKKKLKP